MKLLDAATSERRGPPGSGPLFGSARLPTGWYLSRRVPVTQTLGSQWADRQSTENVLNVTCSRAVGAGGYTHMILLTSDCLARWLRCLLGSTHCRCLIGECLE